MSLFGDAEPFLFLEVALAVKPVLHGGGEAVEGNAITDLESAVGDGKRVVEDGVVGEVAHGEVVEPLDRAGLGGGVLREVFDGNFAQKHGCETPEENSCSR